MAARFPPSFFRAAPDPTTRVAARLRARERRHQVHVVDPFRGERYVQRSQHRAPPATIATQTIVRGTGLPRWSVTICCWVASADVEEDVGEHCLQGVEVRVDVGDDGDAHRYAWVPHAECHARSLRTACLPERPAVLRLSNMVRGGLVAFPDAPGTLVATSGGVIAHHFTVDVEEYFQVAAFESIVPRSDWGRLESRVADNVARVLELLARFEAHATFFVVGWVAERHPDVVRAIERGGHEVASHGWDHARVTEQTPVTFRDSVRRTKYLLEDLASAPVLGYRAPNFSIVPGREWALDILIEEGYRYDSSLFPIRRPGYGYPNGRPDLHWLERTVGRIAEIPPTTLHWCGLHLPAGGGAYFRLLPYALVQAALRQCERRSVPGTFYIHPWELDPGQPRIDVPWLTRLRHYSGLSRAAGRLERLLGEFRFTSVRDTVAALSGAGVTG